MSDIYQRHAGACSKRRCDHRPRLLGLLRHPCDQWV